MSAVRAGLGAGGGRLAAGAMRVSDAERERVARRLAEAHGEGRLTLVEFDERVRSAYGAVIRADLEPLLADLPAPANADLSAPANASLPVPADADLPVSANAGGTGSSSPGRHDRRTRPAPVGPMLFPAIGPCAGHGPRGAVATWAVVSAVNLVIWAAVVAGTGHLVHPWWIWVAGPWGLVLLARLGSRPGTPRVPI